MNPIESAVAPIKEDAKLAARQRVEKMIDFWVEKLEAADWDAEAVAPYPSSLRMSNHAYHAALHDHKFVRAFTSADESRATRFSRRFGDPDYRVKDQVKVDRLIAEWEQLAALQYDEFVAKLNAKVGEVVSATLTGNHVWGHSILTVEKNDGSVERWKTQMIYKLSKLGKPHNQWPTRKVK